MWESWFRPPSVLLAIVRSAQASKERLYAQSRSASRFRGLHRHAPELQAAADQTSRTAHHPLTSSLHTALREDGVRARQQRAGDEDGELLVVESDHPGDGCDFAQRIVVGPSDVRMHGVALSEGPVGRGDSLVGAYGFGDLDPACWTRLIPDFSRGSETIQPDGKKELLRRVPQGCGRAVSRN